VPRVAQVSPSVSSRDGPVDAQLPDEAARVGAVPLMSEKRWVRLYRGLPSACKESDHNTGRVVLSMQSF
jgi:hypothetical protein